MEKLSEQEKDAKVNVFVKSSTIGSMGPAAVASAPPAPVQRPSTQGMRHAGLAVFQQPWWLEIARRGEDYRELHVHQDGIVAGSLGFVVATNHVGNRLGFPPIWSHLGGPVVDQALDRSERSGLIRRLVAQLPRNISFKFVCDPNASDADLISHAFREVGFEHRTETTYVQRAQDPDILSRLSSKHKGHLRRADRDLEVVQLDADRFIKFYRSNLEAAGKQSYASLENARDLIAIGQQDDAPRVRVFAARPRSAGSPWDAAIACAWDDQRYYLWMLTRRRLLGGLSNGDKPHGDAVKLLIFKATQHARSLNLAFDVDGATTEGAKNLYDDILKFPLVESRDVFIRDTGFYKLYKHLQPALRAQIARLKP